MKFRHKMAAVSAATSIAVCAFASAAGAWHIKVDAQTCVNGEPVNQAIATNPAESWNPDTAVFEITDKHGFNWVNSDGSAATTIAKGGSVKVEFPNDNVTRTPAIDGFWKDINTNQQLDKPAGASVTIQQDQNCLPPPVPMNLTVQVVCKAIGGPNGTSEFTLSAKQDPATPAVTFNPADGTKLNSGDITTVTATWNDPNHGPQSKTIETEPIAPCTVTPPPPDTTPKTPLPAVNKATASAVCNGGDYYLQTKLVSGDSNVTFSPEDGTPLKPGQHLVVTASWLDDPAIKGNYQADTINVDVPMTPCAIAMPTTGSAISTHAVAGGGALALGLLILWMLSRKKVNELDTIDA